MVIRERLTDRTSVTRNPTHSGARADVLRAPGDNRLEKRTADRVEPRDLETRIVAFGADETGARYVKVRALVGGSLCERIVAVADLAASGDVVTRELGILTLQARRALCAEVEHANRLTQSNFVVATRPGLNGLGFVLPSGRVLGDTAMHVCLPPGYQDVGGRYVEAGGREWLDVLRLAVGNTRMMLAIAVALCGPVLELLPDLELPMIQLVGPRESGKSTLLRLASSVWMRPDVLRAWSATINSIEMVAAAASGTLLALDELGTYDWSRPSSFVHFRTAVMRLFEGSTRGRMTMASASWRLAVLSSSNLAVHQLAADFGARWDDEFLAAMRSRLIDVTLPAGYGVFEDLHGYRTSQEFVAAIWRIIEGNYGTGGRIFVVRMMRWGRRQTDGGAACLRQWRENYIAAATTRFGEEFARVHQVFATIYAVGRLGVEFNMLPWDSRTFARAILSCEESHVALARSSESSAATTEPLEAVRNHVRYHRETIADLRRGLLREHEFGDHRTRDGYILAGPRGEVLFFVSNEKLIEICGGIPRATALKRQLERSCPSFGGEHRHSVRHTIGEGGRREQGIAIPGSMLGID